MIRLLLDLLYPPKCMFCRRLLESSAGVVCDRCLTSELPEVERELPGIQHFEKAVATFYYKEPVMDAILRFKFHGVSAYAGQFGKWLAVTVRDKLEGQYDLVSWVPCSRRRIWTRGYDQAYLLAKALAAELGMEPVRTLKKVRHNPKQSKTRDPSKRRANVLGAYRAFQPEAFQGKRILLVDDVLTTGATLSECGKTLLLAGSGQLVCAAIAAAHKDNK